MNSSKHIDVNHIPYCIFIIDITGFIVTCNDKALALTGYQQKELMGKPVEMLLQDNVSSSHQKLRSNYQFGSGALATERLIKIKAKSGQLISCSLRVCEDENRFIAYVQESSELSSLYTPYSSQDAQKVLSSIDEAFWEWDIEQSIIHYSAQTMALLGYEPQTFSGPTSFWERHVSADDLKQVYQQITLHFEGKLPCINPTFQITTETGDNRWVTLVGKVFEYKQGKPSKMFGSIKDVTSSYKLIDELQTQNRYLQLAERLGHSGHWHIKLKDNSLYWSEGIYAIHGVKPENYTPTVETAVEFYLDSEQQKINDHLNLAIKEKKPFRFKSTIVQPLGKKVKVEAMGEVELDDNGAVIGVFGVFRDISKSEDIFEKLKLLAMVNYTIKVPIFFIDNKDNIVYQDLSPQTGNQNTVLFNYINFSIKDYLQFKKIARENGQIKKVNISFDKYNTVFDLSVTYEPDEGIYIWIVENVTEKFRKEQQQIISNRLALLGNTFGNVSHDINNVLGVALGATEMLELKVAQGEKDISRYIERVKNAIDKGKSVTERLLAFTRKPPVKVVEFDPIQEINDNLYLFKQLLLSTIEFSFVDHTKKCSIVFPQGEYINILLNIVLNAQDAIKEQGIQGKIEITTYINNNTELEVHIKDSGIGIKQENLSKIFDPFYSSKSVNKGNGIGLANVYSTMYKHNGNIQVAGTSDFGGAEFTLLFKCKLLETAPLETPEKKSCVGVEGKSVLILDDEVSIAEFVALFLDSEGAKTEFITQKSELEQILNSQAHFDVFITDMIMPEISGREAAALILEKYPEIKIYSMSGYIADEDKEWRYPVLRKPFNSKELANFLRTH